MGEGKSELYENDWAYIHEMIKTAEEFGVKEISRFLQIYERFLFNKLTPEEVVVPLLQQLNSPTLIKDRPFHRIIVLDGKYVRVPRGFLDQPVISSVVLDCISEDTEYVVELGSGWGHNLFYIYSQMPFRAEGNDPKYVACEYTKNGRLASEEVASLDPDFNFSAHYFDYNKPDLSFLKGKPNVVFLTRHSIEQIKEVPDSFMEELLDRTGKCTCVHFEPIGWQRSLELKQSVMDGSAGERYTKMHIAIDDDRFVLPNAATWSCAKDYNQNFLEVLDRFQKANKIEFRQISYDVLGVNPFNPSTLVVWDKV